MKKIGIVLLLLCSTFLLASCGKSNDLKPTFKPIDPVPAENTTARDSDNITTGGNAEVSTTLAAETGNVETSGFIDPEKKISYVMYKNGKLVLNGGPILFIVKDNNQLNGKVEKIKEIAFGSEVTEIGKDACKDLTALEKVDFADETKVIDKYAFSGCTSLTEIEFGGVKTIGDYAFEGCVKLSHIELDKLETLGSYAFNKCSDLGNVEFGPNLSLIKNSAFSNCVNLANISFSSSVPAYALSDVSSVASVSIDDNASSIGECAFSGCTNLRSITIGKNVNEIGAFAFENNSSLPSLILPVGIKSVQKNTFAGCSKLSKITLPAGLSTINANAFKDCMGLLEITVPETVTKIDEYAFSDCSNLQTIVLPMSLRTIGNRAFENCTKLTGISFSPMISSISWTCTECGNVNNESDVYCTNCGKEKKGQATTVTTKDGHVNLSIGGYAFSGCSSLSEIDLNIDTIEGYAFYGCTSIKKLKIVASSIGNNAFQGCSGLIDADLKIGGNIGNQAFSQCTSMTDLHLTASTVGNQAFQNCSLLSSVTLNVKQIGNQAFSDCGSITEIDINAEMIGNRALEKCFSLKTVKFTNPNAELGSKILLDCTIDNLYISAKAIPDNCFANTSIKNIIMTTSVERIGVSAFEGCDMITNVVMPSSITEIDNFAFKDCRRLETIVDEKNNSISIPKSVKTIGKRIFDGCESLKTLHICTTTIGEESFAWMPSLETFTVSSDVKTIKKHAFEGCVKLKIVDLKEEKDGASVEIIEDEAFKNCTSLEKFRLPATLKKMGNRIFLNCDEDVFRALVFGGTWAEWRKVDVSKAFKEWSGFRRKNLDMLDWCKNGDSYRNWQ